MRTGRVRKRRTWRFAVLIPALTLAGCATLAGGGPRQSIRINTVPRRTEVRVDGVSVGRAPLAVEVERKSTKVIRIEAQGYHPYEFVLDRGVNPWIWGNFFFPLGFVVDLATGAAYRLSPDRIEVELREGGVQRESPFREGPSERAHQDSNLGPPA